MGSTTNMTSMTGLSKLFLRFAAPLVLVSLVSGCALTARRASIAELKYNPGRYQDRTVSIDGVVTSAFGGPFVPVQMYKVNDGTGELFVISQHGKVPTKGAHVRVKGRVGDVATLGGTAVGLHLRETDLDFKGGR